MNEHEKAFSLGEDAKRFMVSDLGKEFDKISQADIEIAKRAMVELDPYKFTTLPELQNAIAVIQRQAEIATAIRSYVAEAIEIGNQAEHVLNEGD